MEPYLLKLKNLAQRLGVAELIHWVGQLSTEEMSWCFLNSDMFIMTSRVETFGHTAVEAMSFGCACISANNSCLPEVFSDAAILYRPRDSRELAKRIKEVLAWDTPRKKAMSEKAKKRAAFFSWEVCAQKTVTELRKALI
jgi:glycosyltransferase involved in cell wall biosynthesis